jgi:hypothetical protein
MAEKTPKPAEEEVDLNSGATTPTDESVDIDAQSETADAESRSDLNIGRHGDADLASIITPKMTNAEIVDAVLSAPAEKLIPWEDVELPSRGTYYNWTSGVISVRAWGIQVDKILATQRMTQSGQAIDYVLRECCKFPTGFDPTDLLVGDQIFLLYYLRGITHGHVYEFAARSPDTNKMNTYVFDMNELAQTITYADKSLGEEPFDVHLPVLSERLDRDFYVGVRFLRVRDTHQIARNQRAVQRHTGSQVARVKQKQQTKSVAQKRREALGRQQQGAGQASAATQQPIPVDDTLTRNLESLITHVMGVPDRLKIRQLVANLHASDSAVIRTWLADHSPGIDTSVELTDPETSEVFTVPLPITETFFRPQD